MRNTPKSLMQGGAEIMHLKIGECAFTREPLLISTVLGSCVGATFHHRRTGYAGFFHAMLPRQAMASAARAEPCKFVDSAIDFLLERYKKLSIGLNSLECKLFGGAMSLDRSPDPELRAIVDVGARNVAVARERLAEAGIRILTESTQGERGRKLFFYTPTGEVWMKYLQRMDETSLPEHERKQRRL